ncbi:hypothetical protein QBC35DRAFT_16022 [Podospora australis]|uniref:Uncharacterized protein n=1 Tax=Podospora australis TaxID=1536484 RepID=A0AAN6WNU4_9PEZI|nr:hypothetical protein QBC35DRAFT_16022 [Podospora australis]
MRASHWLLTASGQLVLAQYLGQELEGRGYGLDLPRVTAATAPDGVNGWTPKPTEAPYVPGTEDVVELFKKGEQWLKAKRQTGNTWINSKTCAWFSRSSSEPFTCEGTSTCVTNTDRVVACHSSGATRPFYTVCFDYDAAQRGACSSMGTKTGCCFTSSIGACITYLWPEGTSQRSMYRCHTASSIISMQDLPQFLLETTRTITRTSTRTTSRTSTTSTATSSSTSSESAFPDPGSEATSTDSSTGTLTGASATGTGTSGPVITAENSGSSNAGAIAGGVVGGVAGLALIAGAVAFLLIRSRNKSNNTHSKSTGTSPSTNPAYSAVPPGPGPPGPGGYPSPQMTGAGGGYFSPGSFGNAPTLHHPETPYLASAAAAAVTATPSPPPPQGAYADPRQSYYDPAKLAEQQQPQQGYSPYGGYQPSHLTPSPHSGGAVPSIYPSPPPGSGMGVPPPMPVPGQQYHQEYYNGVLPGAAPYASPPPAQQQHFATELDAIPAGQQGNPVEIGVNSPIQHR